MMKVKVGKIPGRTSVVELNEGATIAEALREAGISAVGYELRLSGQVTEDFNKTVQNGDVVLLAQKIKGNSGGCVDCNCTACCDQCEDGDLCNDPDCVDEDDCDCESEDDENIFRDDDGVLAFTINGEEYTSGKPKTFKKFLEEIGGVVCMSDESSDASYIIKSNSVSTVSIYRDDTLVDRVNSENYGELLIVNGSEYELSLRPITEEYEASEATESVTEAIANGTLHCDSIEYNTNIPVIINIGNYKVVCSKDKVEVTFK